ncbi:MAG: UV DNA damage repair endonuclease UvsE [Candidatus Bathyarchaeota archaeon]|nr:UV DNA damage repair endonuclease UvsE [Candidatus Bathyarchaeota archaeon]
MKIGYPCINLTIGCKGDRTFRLRSYSEKRLIKTVENNLSCLIEMLKFNAVHNILFFRITSDLVPFASHPVCQFNWQEHFEDRFRAIGDLIESYDIRISMHPDQFVLINSLDSRVLENSLRELAYHAQVLDLMKLDASAKIQIHVGGVYGDKEKSMKKFVERFEKLDEIVKRRLVIENDDKRYRLEDCLQINAETEIPVLFDVFHHEVNNSGETTREAFELCTKTWKEKDGIPMVDYSSQQIDELKGKHADSIDLEHFRRFLDETRPLDFDIMLEIKDKEKSALKAVKVALQDDRFEKVGQVRKDKYSQHTVAEVGKLKRACAHVHNVVLS